MAPACSRGRRAELCVGYSCVEDCCNGGPACFAVALPLVTPQGKAWLYSLELQHGLLVNPCLVGDAWNRHAAS